MFFYLLLWFYLLLCSTSKNIHITAINIFILSLIAGCRSYDIGTDTYSYLEIFNVLEKGENSYIEPGWQLLNKIIIFLGGNFSLFLFFVSLLTLFPLLIFFKKNSTNPNFSLFIYYSLYAYCNSFNGMRQFLAISLIFLTYMYYNQGNVKRFILFLLIATSVHFSAFIGVIVCFSKKIKLTSNILYWGLISTLIGGIFINESIFKIILGPYSHYLSGNQGFRSDFVSSFMLSFLVDFIFVVLYTTGRKEFKTNIWVKLYFIGLLLMNLTFQLILGTRIILYLTLLQTIVYPLYLKRTRIKEVKFVLLIMILYLSLVFLKILILGNLPNIPGSIIPYKTIFSV